MSPPTRLNPLRPVWHPGPGCRSWGGHLVLDSVSSSRGQLQNLCQNEAGSTGPHLLLPCPAATWGTFPATSPGGVCSDVCVCVSQRQRLRNKLKIPCPGPAPAGSLSTVGTCLHPSLPPTESWDQRRWAGSKKGQLILLPTSCCCRHRPLTPTHGP